MSLIRELTESYRELFSKGPKGIDINPEDAGALRTAITLIKKHDGDELPVGTDIIFKGSADANKTREALKSLLKQIDNPADRNATAAGDGKLLANMKKTSFSDYIEAIELVLKNCKDVEAKSGKHR